MKYLLLIVGFLTLSFTSPALAQKLTEGNKALFFSIKDVNKNKLKLRKELRKNRILLVFLRHAWCPVCNARTHDLINKYDELKAKGIEVVVVYQSKNDRLVDYAKDYNLPYKVIGDPEHKLYELYKLYDDEKNLKESLKSNEKVKEMYKKGEGFFAKNKGNIYHEEQEEGKFYISADFLIEQNGKISKAYYGKFLGDHWSIEETLSYKSPSK